MSNRREFVEKCVTAGAAALLPPSSPGAAPTPDLSKSPNREFAFVSLAAAFMVQLLEERTNERNQIRLCSSQARLEFKEGGMNFVDSRKCAEDACAAAKLILDEAKKV